MTDDHDELLTSLARLAPAADPPPEPGSSRYDSILERAMTATDTTSTPYASSSAAVVEAALESATVEDLGREQVQGVEATHYRITLDQAGKEALAALSPRVVAQFELEYPSVGDRLDIWVADDLIRRLRVDTEIRRTDIELRDFGADIDIQPPA